MLTDFNENLIIFFMKKETWLDIKGYEGFYQVSNLGRIRSIDRISCGRNLKGRIIKQTKNKMDYMLCILSKEGKTSTKKVHRLVAEAFLVNTDNKPQVNHINGIKYQNNVENLEWATFSENQTHAYKNGLSISSKGESHGRSKITEDIVLEIRNFYKEKNIGYKKLGDLFGLSKSNIRSIVKRETWKHI